MIGVGRVLAASLVAAVLAAGCGEDGSSSTQDGSPAGPAVAELRRLTEDGSLDVTRGQVLAASDFRVAREQAGLPENADLSALGLTLSGPEGALGTLTRDMLGFVGSPFGDVAELQAFDGSAISSAARTLPDFGEPGTLVIETDQDFDEIEAGLVSAGMTREGDVLSAGGERTAPSYFPLVAAGPDGTVVLTDDPAVAGAAGEATPDVPAESSGEPAAGPGALLESRGAGAAFAMAAAPSNGCVDGVLATQGVEPMSGAITLLGSIAPGNVEVVGPFRAGYDVEGPHSQPGQIDVRFAPRTPFRGDAIAYTELLDRGAAVKFSC